MNDATKGPISYEQRVIAQIEWVGLRKLAMDMGRALDRVTALSGPSPELPSIENLSSIDIPDANGHMTAWVRKRDAREVVHAREQQLRAELAEASNSDEEITRLKSELKASHAREQAAVKLALEEHQAALCPEDYGCKEYIASLQRQIHAREQAVRDEKQGIARIDELLSALAGCARQWKEHVESCSE